MFSDIFVKLVKGPNAAHASQRQGEQQVLSGSGVDNSSEIPGARPAAAIIIDTGDADISSIGLKEDLPPQRLPSTFLDPVQAGRKKPSNTEIIPLTPSPSIERFILPEVKDSEYLHDGIPSALEGAATTKELSKEVGSSNSDLARISYPAGVREPGNEFTTSSDNSTPSKSLDSSTRFKNLILAEESFQKGYFARMLQKYWSMLKRPRINTSVLEGPRLSIPKLTLIEYLMKKLSSQKIASDSTAVIQDRQDSISFAKLDSRSYILGKLLIDVLEDSAMLSNHSPNTDLVIALTFPNSLKLIILVLAILKIGATYLPLSPNLPLDRIKKILTTLRPVLYIYSGQDATHSKKVSELEPAGLTAFYPVDRLWKGLEEAEYGFHPGDRQFVPLNVTTIGKLELLPKLSRSAVIFPSFSPLGTVSPLKFRHRAILSRLFWEWRSFPYERKERFPLQSPVHEVHSVPQIFGPLLQGIPLVIIHLKDLEHPFLLPSKVQDYSISRLTLTSSWLKAFLTAIELSPSFKDWRLGLATLKYIFVLGEPLGRDLAEDVFRHLVRRLRGRTFVAVVNLLETSENLGALSYKIVSSHKSMSSELYFHVGSPIPNTIVYVLDESFGLVPRGTPGELFVSSLQTCQMEATHLEVLSDCPDDYQEHLFFKNHLVREEESLNDAVPKAITKNLKHPIDGLHRKLRSQRKNFPCLQRTGCFGLVLSSCSCHHELLLESREPFQMLVEGTVYDIREIRTYLCRSSSIKDVHLLIYNTGEPSQKLLAFCIPATAKDSISTWEKDRLLCSLKEKLVCIVPQEIFPDIILLQSIPKTFDGKINDNILLRIYELERKSRYELHDVANLLQILQSQDRLRAASVFLPLITSMLGIPVDVLAENLHRPFSYFGLTVAQSITILSKLHASQYTIGLEEFLKAPNLLRVIQEISKLEKKEELFSLRLEFPNRAEMYDMELITDFHKSEVVKLLSDILLSKGTFESQLGIHREEIRAHLNRSWTLFTYKYFSFVAIGTKGRYKQHHVHAGVIINVNSAKYFQQLRQVKSTSRAISYKQQVIEYLNTGKLTANRSNLLEILYLGCTSKHLDSQEKVRILQALIGQAIKVAKFNQLEAVIFPCFDDYLTGICIRDYGFKIVMQCQLNRFIATDGHQPFRTTSDTFVASLCYKNVL